MLGRLKTDKSLQIGGVGTSVQSDSILNAVNKNYGFKLVLSPEGYGHPTMLRFTLKMFQFSLFLQVLMAIIILQVIAPKN